MGFELKSALVGMPLLIEEVEGAGTAIEEVEGGWGIAEKDEGGGKLVVCKEDDDSGGKIEEEG